MIKIINITNPKTLDLIYDVSDTEYLNTSTGNIMTIEIDNLILCTIIRSSINEIIIYQVGQNRVCDV